MSVHPAAITLAETGFDYPALLASPGYADGGPNTHSLSLYTAIAAGAYAVFNPPTAIVALHLLSFVFGALAGVALVRLGGHFVPAGAAVVIAALSIAFPLVLTQFGMLYLEAPLLTATLWALVAAIEQRWVAAAAFGLLATSVKPSGAITAASLALFYLMNRRSATKALAILAPSVIVLGVQTISSPGFAEPSLLTGALNATYSWRYLANVPDLLSVLLVAMLGGRYLLRREPKTTHNQLGIILLTFALTYCVFHATIMYVGFWILPRYYNQILPLALTTFLVATYDKHGHKAFKWTAAALLVLSVLNFNGAVYPGQPTNNFALAERSDAYDQLLALEVAGAAAICELSVEAPVWYSKPEAYRLQYPQMGYADCSPDGHPVQRDSDLELEDLPETLFVAFEHPWLGGGALHRLVTEARSSPNWTVEVVRTLAVGNFHQDIYRLTRLSSD